MGAALPSSFRIVTREDFDKVLDSADNVTDFFIATKEPVRVNVQGRNETVLNRLLDEGELRQIIYILGDEASGLYDGIMSQTKPRGRSYTTKSSLVRYRVLIARIADRGQGKIRIVMRRLQSQPWELDKLRLPTGFLKVAFKRTPGLILVAGATGSGKTALLSGILRAIVSNPDGHPHLVTIEDPVEYLYDEVRAPNAVVSPMEIGEGCSSFEEGLRASLRMKPTHILVGEIRDPETASTCIAAARSGHLVLATIHTSSVPEIFSRWADFYPESGKRRAITDLAAVLDYAIYQTLDHNEMGFSPVQESIDFTQFSRSQLVGVLQKNVDDIYTTAHSLVKEFGTPHEVDWATQNPNKARERANANLV